MEEYEASLSSKDWKESVNDKKEGLIISLRTNSDGLSCVKATGIVDFPILDIYKTLGDTKYR